MSPRQVIPMVVASAGFLALVAGALAVPAGVAVSRVLFNVVANLAVAVAAAMFPGRWAARTNVVEVVRAE